jgi:hypothetical protein
LTSLVERRDSGSRPRWGVWYVGPPDRREGVFPMRLLKRLLVLAPLLALAVVLVGLPTVAFGGNDDGGRFNARLIGINETPAAINTDGSASLRLKLNNTTIDFELTFHNLSTLPIQSHIHFGQVHTSGGVVLFFCGPAASPAKQTCPQAVSGPVTGTLTAADVQPVPGQGIKAGDMAAVMRAIREGAAYGNLHTVDFPTGEIRGQIGRLGF